MGYVIHIQPGFAGDALTGVQKLLQLRPVAAALDMHLKYHSSSYLSIYIYNLHIYILHYITILDHCVYIDINNIQIGVHPISSPRESMISATRFDRFVSVPDSLLQTDVRLFQ
jgi:hypothetical protein